MSGRRFTDPTIDSSNFTTPENVILRNEIEIEEMKRIMKELRRQHPDVFYGGNKRSNRRKHARHNKRTRKGSRMHKKMH